MERWAYKLYSLLTKKNVSLLHINPGLQAVIQLLISFYL